MNIYYLPNLRDRLKYSAIQLSISHNVISGHKVSEKSNSEYEVLVGKNPLILLSFPLLKTKSISS